MWWNKAAGVGLVAGAVGAMVLAAGAGPGGGSPPRSAGGYALTSAGGTAVMMDTATGDAWVLRNPDRGDPTWVPVKRPPEAAKPPKDPNATSPAAPVEPSKPEPPRPALASVGRLVPTQSARIRPRVAGVVGQVLVKEGQAVRAGDVLVELDVTDAKLALDAAKAQLAAAQAGLLPVEMQGVSKFERARAEAQVRRAEVEVTRAQAGLDAMRIRSPLAGRVVSVRAAAGEVVGPSDPPVFEVATLGDLELVAGVSEADADRLKVGMECRVLVGDRSPVAFPAAVTRVGAVVDPTTGTVEVRAWVKVPAGGKPPRAGAVARLDIKD